MQMLNIEKGSVADCLYIQFSEKPISHSVELGHDIILDVAEDNTVVGFDVQYVAEVMKEYRLVEKSVKRPSTPFTLQLVGA